MAEMQGHFMRHKRDAKGAFEHINELVDEWEKRQTHEREKKAEEEARKKEKEEKEEKEQKEKEKEKETAASQASSSTVPTDAKDNENGDRDKGKEKDMEHDIKEVKSPNGTETSIEVEKAQVADGACHVTTVEPMEKAEKASDAK